MVHDSRKHEQVPGTGWEVPGNFLVLGIPAMRVFWNELGRSGPGIFKKDRPAFPPALESDSY